MENFKVLCAEDDELARVEIKEKLQAKGWVVIEARNGKEAFALYEKEEPDLIILDVDMPEMTGLEVLELIRTNDLHTPVVIYSSLAREEDLKAGYAYGVKVYLIKEYSIDILMAQLENLVAPEETGIITLTNGVNYDFAKATLMIGEQGIKLSMLESKVFAVLCRNLNKLVRRELLIKAGWRDSVVDCNYQLNKVMSKLRKVLKATPNIVLDTDKSRGYWLKKLKTNN